MEQNQSFIDKLPRFLRATLRGYKGRVCRRDFWLFLGFSVVVSIIVGIIGFIIAAISKNISIAHLFYFILLVPIIPMIVLSVLCDIGRLHDLGRSGWWFLIYFMVYIWLGYNDENILTIIWFCFHAYLGFAPSQKESNKWGDNPTAKLPDSAGAE